MAYRKRFLLSDESINTFGFWILLSGLDLTQAKKNCPLFYNHRTWEVPCGHVENIELKNGRLEGDIVIDGGNEIEKEYIRKIENGDIKGCSIGADPIEWSEDSKYLKPSQRRATLTKGLLFEVSLAPLPGNQNALALRNGTDMITLDAEKTMDFIPELKTKTNMEELAILLGMDKNSTALQLCNALKPILLKAANADALQKVVDEQLTEGLTEDQKKFYLELSKTDVNKALEYVKLSKAAAPAATDDAPVVTLQSKTEKLSDLIQKNKPAQLAADAEGKNTFDYLQKKNPVELGRIKAEEPDNYKALVADYGKGVRYTGK